MNVWCWLSTNSEALQGVFALLGAVLTVVTICVLIATLRAVNRQAIASESQAGAARALIQVAEEQTKAAKDAAASAKTQCDLQSRQLELSTAPLLVAEPDDRPNMKNYKLANRGQGMAFQVYYWQGGLEKDEQMEKQGGVRIFPVQPSTLAPGSYIYVPIPPGWDSWTARYKGSDRQERWTIVYRDANKAQEHVIRQGLQKIYLY